MTKAELREHLEQQLHRHTVIYGEEVLTYAADVTAPKKLNRQLDSRKAEAPLLKENWENYLTQLADGTYKPQHSPSEDLWEFE